MVEFSKKNRNPGPTNHRFLKASDDKLRCMRPHLIKKPRNKLTYNGKEETTNNTNQTNKQFKKDQTNEQATLTTKDGNAQPTKQTS